MKRIIAALIAFALLLSLSFASRYYLYKTCDEISSALLSAAELAEKDNFSDAAKTAKNAELFFKERKRLLSFTVNHGLFYEAESLLSGLFPLARKESKEEFLCEAAKTQRAVENLRKNK